MYDFDDVPLSQLELVEVMHDKMGHTSKFREILQDEEKTKQLLKLRNVMHKEECREYDEALEKMDMTELLDAAVDLAVFALGTIDIISGTYGEEAFEEVMNANSKKTPGVKPGRPNPLGLPDLIKPEGWKSPDVSSFVRSELKRMDKSES